MTINNPSNVHKGALKGFVAFKGDFTPSESARVKEMSEMLGLVQDASPDRFEKSNNCTIMAHEDGRLAIVGLIRKGEPMIIEIK